MESFELFPKIKGAIKWMAEHSDSVIHFGWNVVAAIILLFIGKLIARLLSRGWKNYFSGGKWMPLLSTFSPRWFATSR